MSDTANITVTAAICRACRDDRHYQCRGPEWSCPCPHSRALAPAPAVSANRSPAGTDVAEAAGGAAGVAGEAPRPFHSSRPEWWGEHGCRFAGGDDHVCRTSFGAPLQPGQVCFSEARASLRDEMVRSYAE